MKPRGAAGSTETSIRLLSGAWEAAAIAARSLALAVQLGNSRLLSTECHAPRGEQSVPIEVE